MLSEGSLKSLTCKSNRVVDRFEGSENLNIEVGFLSTVQGFIDTTCAYLFFVELFLLFILDLLIVS